MTRSQQPSAASEWRANWTLVLTAMVGYSVAAMHAGSAGVMMGPVTEEFGWSRTEFYFGISLVSIVNMALATFMGVAIDRYGPRIVAISTTTIMFCAAAFMSTADSNLIGWWARWLLVGIGISAMPTVWVIAVAARFNVSRGLAVAVALSGSGIGTSFAPIITHALVESYGWRGGYIGLPAIWAAVAMPLILLFFHGPERRPAPNPEMASQQPKPDDLPGLTRSEGFRSKSFWILLFGGAGATLGGIALVMNLVPVLVSTGLTRGMAASVAGLIGISTIVGRVTGGWLSDRFAAKWVAFFATLLAIVLPVGLLLFPGSVMIAAGSVVLYGFMGGAKVGALAYLATRYLGQRAFGALYGAINASIALVVAIAPLLANYVYDRTQSYEPAMWAAVPVLVTAALLYLLLGAYPDFSQDKTERAG
ncbi:MAG: MFS transporter [Novosphingobium sp.]|nr:MFS transporter [Novosphingobium sp.]